MLNLNQLKLTLASYFFLVLPLWAQSTHNPLLIDVTTLDQLYALRYDLDGDGTPSGTVAEEAAYRTAFRLTGSMNNTCVRDCKGYELMNDLDFDDTDSGMDGKQLSKWSKYATDPGSYPAGTTATFSGTAERGGWVPIGDNSLIDPSATATDAPRHRFTATFDGNGRRISNLYINTSTLSRVGLFGYVGSGGVIRKLGLEGGSVTGGNSARVGGLVGINDGTISACHATGNATGGNATRGNPARVGGLVGYNHTGSINDCYATGSTEGGRSADVGGLVGINEGTISACHATGNATGGNATAGNPARVGGLVGYNHTGSINDCYATGSTEGRRSAEVGGLVGYNYGGNISACYATGNTTGGNYAGGLVGHNYGGNISACYATGNVEGTFSVGGLVGYSNKGTVSACYATGNVRGAGILIGGLVGQNSTFYPFSHGGSTISACYATGNVDGGNYARAGGLVGLNGLDGQISACYATGNVTGGNSSQVGGLAGKTSGSTGTIISACYSTGNVSGGSGANVGGLVGQNSSKISACYSTGSAEGGSDANVGGLVGYKGGSINNSYFGSETATSTALAKTTAQLQYPTAYDGLDAASGGTAIYSAWNIDIDNADADNNLTTGVDDPWDFVGNNRYPKLKVDFDGGTGMPTAAEFGLQRFYFTNSSDVEVISLSVPENTTSGTIGYAKALSSTVAAFSMTGMSDNFAISSTGEITVQPTADLDYEYTAKNFFELSIIATIGSENTALKLNIEVTDVAGEVVPFFTFPERETSFNFKALDGSAGGTVVSKITATDDMSSILTYTLSGTGSSDFTVDGSGQMTVSSGVTLSLSAMPTYMLTVKATDEAGNVSSRVDVGITLVDPAVNVGNTRLIDVTSLAQLHAIRYDLDGDGTPPMDKETDYRSLFSVSQSTCNDGSSVVPCEGYELRANLDFAGTKWENPTGGSFTASRVPGGWVPIGDNNTNWAASRFTATFEGNGHTIANLYINTSRSGLRYVGLFGAVGSGGEIRNLGLEGGSVEGENNTEVGGLVGKNAGGTIIACYSTGNVSGGSGAVASQMSVGGLVGTNDGGTISACYATGSARGGEDYAHVGGLVGKNDGSINACYATGSVTGEDWAYVGGLVGKNDGSISACYATGNVEGSVGISWDGGPSWIGGLVGSNKAGTIIDSYYSSDATITNTRLGGVNGEGSGQTASALRTPLAYGASGAIYPVATWNVDIDNDLAVGIQDGTMAGDPGIDNPWDFGSSSQYPALKVDFDGGGTATVAEFGPQRELRFSSPSYSFGVQITVVVSAEVGRVYAIPADFNHTLSYRITSQTLGGTPVTAFGIASADQGGANVGVISVASRLPSLTEGDVYTLGVEVDNGLGETKTTVVSIEVVPYIMSDGVVTNCATTFLDHGGYGNYRNNQDITTTFAPVIVTDRVRVEFSSYRLGYFDTLFIYHGGMVDPSKLVNMYSGPLLFPPTVISASSDGKLTFRFVSSPTFTLSGWEASVSCVTLALPGAVPSTSLSLTVVSDRQINLSWEAPTHDGGHPITNYQIQITENDNFSGFNATANATDTEVTLNVATDLTDASGVVTLAYAHRGLTAGTTYHYRIAAINSEGTGLYSNSVSATTHDVPGVPRGLTVTVASDTHIQLSWQAPTHDGGHPITGYQLQYSTDGINFVNLTITNETTLSYQQRILSRRTKYHYQVAAVNSVGTGAYSNSVTIAGDSDGSADTFAVPKVVVDLSLYPNPTLGVVSIEGLSSARRYLYKVYSLVGEEILSGKLGSSAVIDLSELSSGQYILVLKDEEGGRLLRRKLLLLK